MFIAVPIGMSCFNRPRMLCMSTTPPAFQQQCYRAHAWLTVEFAHGGDQSKRSPNDACNPDLTPSQWWGVVTILLYRFSVTLMLGWDCWLCWAVMHLWSCDLMTSHWWPHIPDRLHPKQLLLNMLLSPQLSESLVLTCPNCLVSNSFTGNVCQWKEWGITQHV